MIKIGLRRRPDGAAELRVEDNGVGLGAEVDFHRTESLGLQIVNLLAGQLDATLEVDQTKGTGIALIFKEQKYKPRF